MSEHVNNTQPPPEKLTLYSWRWVVVVLFVLAVFVNSIPGEIYVPIAEDLEKIYDTSETMITLASTSYMIMHPILSIPCSQFIVSYGWATATNVGVILSLMGSFIKLLVNETGFYVIVIGQTLIGAGKPFILNAQATLAQNWFYPEARPVIITVLNVLNLVSNVVTMMIPGKWIFKGYEIDKQPTDTQIEEGKDRMNTLNWLQIYFALTMIPCLILLKSKPLTPPLSILAQLQDKKQVPKNVIKTLIKILTNKNFLCCLISYSIYLGMTKALVLILSYIFGAFDFGREQVSLAGSIAYACAVTSQASVASIIQKYQNYKKQLLLGMMFLSTAFFGVFYLSLISYNIYFIYAAIGAVGFFIMPIVPIIMDVSCDTIFPIDPSFAIGIMYIGSQLLVVIFTQALAIVVGGTNSNPERVGITIGIEIIFQIGALILFTFLKLKHQSMKVIDSFNAGRSLLQKGQAISSTYKGSSFFNCASSIAFVGVVPTSAYTDNQQSNEQQYSSEIAQITQQS